MKMNNKSGLILLAAAAGAVIVLGGCATENGTHSKVVHNLSPEMLSLTHRPVDAQNKTSLTWNADKRMIWNDLSRAALTDRPSRLSKSPIPH